MSGGTLTNKDFDSLHEAVEYSIKLPIESVQEITKVEPKAQKENRT
jgi:hypothetical protein